LDLARKVSLSHLKTGQAKVAIVGLGHVGLPFAALLASRGGSVIGVDKDETLLKKLIKGIRTIYEPGLDRLLKKVVNRNLKVTRELVAAARESSVVVITVGTPVTKKGPDLRQVKSASAEVANGLAKGKTVILSSTVPPGTTENIVKPLLENRSHLVAGRDFGLAYCPERLVEGQALKELKAVPHIVGGIDVQSVTAASTLFKFLGGRVIEVESPKIAEMAKIFDNVYRDVNIALANELALICEKLGLDTIKTIRACNTGPRTRVLTPGCGVGGSCLTKDPYMLAEVSARFSFKPQLLTTARKTNEDMPNHLVALVKSAYRELGKAVRGSKITILGLSFKKGTDDMRETVAKPIVEHLRRLGAKIVTCDPYVSTEDVKRILGKLELIRNPIEAMRGSDCIIVVTDHDQYARLTPQALAECLNSPAAVVDGRHIFDPLEVLKSGLIFRGVGRPIRFYKEVCKFD